MLWGCEQHQDGKINNTDRPEKRESREKKDEYEHEHVILTQREVSVVFLDQCPSSSNAAAGTCCETISVDSQFVINRVSLSCEYFAFQYNFCSGGNTAQNEKKKPASSSFKCHGDGSQVERGASRIVESLLLSVRLIGCSESDPLSMILCTRKLCFHDLRIFSLRRISNLHIPRRSASAGRVRSYGREKRKRVHSTVNTILFRIFKRHLKGNERDAIHCNSSRRLVPKMKLTVVSSTSQSNRVWRSKVDKYTSTNESFSF